uniref:Uncharacterized protein n=1 Tax=Candidatus Kentrum sp. TC TaxID=2126339 RepID=A0A450YWF8_9GAMM|nr:MAG: hypothetical protein BECKTC1821E_GA0114239_105511 [Candidatus Kentron sp. TC]VFK52380.1 MAG: hypothetical protein BECKTC1821D_GA0114238_11762 [Candidatus Kentron sp. TC]
MNHDPIIKEIHAFRKAYAKRFGYDLKAICDDLRTRQAARPNLVDLSEKRRAMGEATVDQISATEAHEEAHTARVLSSQTASPTV